MMPPEEALMHLHWGEQRDKFPQFAPEYLRIRDKRGHIVPFDLNDAQLYLHNRLEDQREARGFVRALVLKGRQQGCSTYVAGRFYAKNIQRFGCQTFILAHEAAASSNLFSIPSRMQNHMPEKLRPYVGASNAKELLFPDLDGGYRVGTAGSKAVGRSFTAQLFHGSEVAFWPHAEEHGAGILQTVPLAPGTEVIFESTAYGMGGYFHQQWRKAVAGESDFIAVFIPWFWQKEYRAQVPEGMLLTDEEAEYQATFDLDMEQMAWRRSKIAEMGEDGDQLFRQEYPATPEEAFQTTGLDSYISPLHVARCRKTPPRVSTSIPVVAGYDPKRDGKDRGAFIYRQGATLWGLEYNRENNFNNVVVMLKKRLDTAPRIARLFIDYGGSGWELGQVLHAMGYADRVVVVNFGSAARDPEHYANRRAEMWAGLRATVHDREVPASLPDNDAFQADLCAGGFGYDARTRLLLESKDQIHERSGVSPDGGDAAALTFAEPVHLESAEVQEQFAAGSDYDPLARARSRR